MDCCQTCDCFYVFPFRELLLPFAFAFSSVALVSNFAQYLSLSVSEN